MPLRHRRFQEIIRMGAKSRMATALRGLEGEYIGNGLGISENSGRPSRFQA